VRRKKYTAPERYDPLYSDILKELGNDRILIKTILKSCFIAKIENMGDALLSTIDAPNRYYGQILDVRVREKLLLQLEQKIGQKVVVEIVNSSRN